MLNTSLWNKATIFGPVTNATDIESTPERILFSPIFHVCSGQAKSGVPTSILHDARGTREFFPETHFISKFVFQLAKLLLTSGTFALWYHIVLTRINNERTSIKMASLLLFVQPKPGESTPLTSFSSSATLLGADDEDGAQSLIVVSTQHYKLYARRWLVLASYGLLLVSNQWIWAIWSPLTALLADYWDVDESSVDALSGVYMYVFVPMNIVAMWLVVNYLGLARGLHVGAFFNSMGAAIMYGFGRLDLLHFLAMTDYQVKYLGVFFCALGQAFILPVVALLSGNWFGGEERATATSFGTLAVQLGTLFGLASTMVVDFRDNDTGRLDPFKLERYLHLQWIVSLLALAAVLITLTRDRPPTPPSQAAATLAQDATVSVKYLDSVRLVLRSPSSRAFFFLFGLVIGSFYSIPAFLSQFMPDWPPRHQGMLGAIFQIAAVTGCYAAGRLVLWLQLQYKKICFLLLGGCLVSATLYLVSVKFQSYLAMVACGGMGFFFSSFMSVGIEFATALTFPADEAAVYGLLDSTGELSGFLLVTLGGSLSQVNMEVYFCGTLVVLVGMAFIMLWRLDPLVRRPSLLSAASFSSFVYDPNEASSSRC